MAYSPEVQFIRSC
jgi:hypothetical protein